MTECRELCNYREGEHSCSSGCEYDNGHTVDADDAKHRCGPHHNEDRMREVAAARVRANVAANRQVSPESVRIHGNYFRPSVSDAVVDIFAAQRVRHIQTVLAGITLTPEQAHDLYQMIDSRLRPGPVTIPNEF